MAQSGIMGCIHVPSEQRNTVMHPVRQQITLSRPLGHRGTQFALWHQCITLNYAFELKGMGWDEEIWQSLQTSLPHTRTDSGAKLLPSMLCLVCGYCCGWLRSLVDLCRHGQFTTRRCFGQRERETSGRSGGLSKQLVTRSVIAQHVARQSSTDLVQRFVVRQLAPLG